MQVRIQNFFFLWHQWLLPHSCNEPCLSTSVTNQFFVLGLAKWRRNIKRFKRTVIRLSSHLEEPLELRVRKFAGLKHINSLPCLIFINQTHGIDQWVNGTQLIFYTIKERQIEHSAQCHEVAYHTSLSFLTINPIKLWETHCLCHLPKFQTSKATISMIDVLTSSQRMEACPLLQEIIKQLQSGKQLRCLWSPQSGMGVRFSLHQNWLHEPGNLIFSHWLLGAKEHMAYPSDRHFVNTNLQITIVNYS